MSEEDQIALDFSISRNRRLKEENERLKQQLAETQARYILIPKDDNFRIINYEQLQQQEQRLAEATALLEYWFSYGDDDRNWAPTQKDHDEQIAKTRAFLAK